MRLLRIREGRSMRLNRIREQRLGKKLLLSKGSERGKRSDSTVKERGEAKQSKRSVSFSFFQYSINKSRFINQLSVLIYIFYFEFTRFKRKRERVEYSRLLRCRRNRERIGE